MPKDDAVATQFLGAAAADAADSIGNYGVGKRAMQMAMAAMNSFSVMMGSMRMGMMLPRSRPQAPAPKPVFK